MPVTRDPSSPDFPHATPAGRRRGCDCTPCRLAKARQDKTGRIARELGRATYYEPALEDQARAHVTALLTAVPLATVVDIAAAAGISRTAARNLHNRAVRRSSAASCRAVLAVTPKELTARARLTTVASITRAVRVLESLGYPVSWQERHTSLRLRTLIALPADATAPNAALHTLELLTKTLCDVTAKPGPDLTGDEIEAARDNATRHGVYPPMSYDDDGNLIARSIPGHRWTRNDDMAARRLRAVNLILRDTQSRDDAAEQCAMTSRNFQRLVSDVHAMLDAVDPNTQRSNPAAVRARIETALWDWDRGEVPATLTALRLGVLSGRAVCADHPDLITWRTEVALAQIASLGPDDLALSA